MVENLALQALLQTLFDLILEPNTKQGRLQTIIGEQQDFKDNTYLAYYYPSENLFKISPALASYALKCGRLPELQYTYEKMRLRWEFSHRIMPLYALDEDMPCNAEGPWFLY